MMATGAVRYSVIAREGDTFSDEPLRHYYKEWSRRIARPYWDPFGEVSTGARECASNTKTFRSSSHGVF